MKEMISRQQAIDAVDSETVSTNPEHFKSSEKFIQFMDDKDISSFGRWQWSNGYNTALIAVGIDLKKLPSIQPERKTGRWIFVASGRGGYECSCCHEYAPSYRCGEDRLSNFCPNCGAKMDGGEQDGR